MDFKLVLSLLVLVQLAVSISYTPEDEKKPPKPGCVPKQVEKSSKRSYIRYNRNSRYGRSRYGKSRVDATPTELTCKNVVTYFDGTFSKETLRVMKVRFEYRLEYKNNKYYGEMKHWDESVNPSNKFSWCFGETNNKFNITGGVASSVRSNYYGTNLGTRYGVTDYVGETHINFLDLKEKPNEGLILKETVGQCTKVTHQYEESETWMRDLYKKCVCCGEYNPDPSLGCPVNPWAPEQKKPDC